MESAILSPREIRRYGKQIMLPEIGIKGQERIKQASVLVIGAGGLGCPVLQYLTVAGIGKIGIAEFDTVDETNLQRQVLYGSMDVGKLKSIIARDRLNHLNSLVSIEIINLRIDASSALKVISNYDVIVDATDNYDTRYLINDACIMHAKPMVYGAIFRNEGRVSVFNYNDGPSYRCFNPEDKSVQQTVKDPRPADVGLIGVLPGITGTIMANEVLKIVTGTGVVLSGKILIFNISGNNYRTIKISKNPENFDKTAIRNRFENQ